jgi:hypothetical protein
MNEIILAPCDVISKIKQNSSDMNEIILAPCDAGYVQSCTGSVIDAFAFAFLTLSSLLNLCSNNYFTLSMTFNNLGSNS